MVDLRISNDYIQGGCYPVIYRDIIIAYGDDY